MASSGRAAASAVAAIRGAVAALAQQPGGISDDHPLVVGFSGGLDSTVLLHALVCELGAAQIIACHVDHGLQSVSPSWQAHCEAVARAHGCRYETSRLPAMPAQPAGGVEAWARAGRRGALFDACRRHDAAGLLLAHHRDDQVETLLLNWGRGSGPAGMTGMPARSVQHGVCIMRPLLGLARSDLQHYARQCALVYIDDPSNQLLVFRRNQVRHQLLPALEAVFPGFRGNILRAAGLTKELVDAAGIGPYLPPEGFDRRCLQGLNVGARERCLRAWIVACGLRTPGSARSRHLREVLIDADSVRAEVAHDGRLLHRYRHFVSNDAVVARLMPAPGGVALGWHGESRLRVSGWPGAWNVNEYLSADAGVNRPEGIVLLNESVLRASGLTVLPLRSSAVMRTHPHGPNRRLKQLCQEAGIPVWTRRTMPMLELGGRVVAVPGLGVNAAPADVAVDATGQERRFIVDYAADPG